MSSITARLWATGPIHPDMQRWANALVAAGGIVSRTRLLLNSALISGFQVIGTYGLLDDIIVPAAENSLAQLLSWKQLRFATAVNSPTFTVDRGSTADGVASYLNSNFVPSTHCKAATAASNRLAVYNRTAVSGNGYDVGQSTASLRAWQLRARTTGNLAGYNGSSDTINSAADVTSGQGFVTGSRSGAAIGAPVSWYRNGTKSTADAAIGATAASMGVYGVLIGATTSTSNVPTSFKAGERAYVEFSAAFTPAQEAAHYALLQQYMTAIGAQV